MAHMIHDLFHVDSMIQTYLLFLCIPFVLFYYILLLGICGTSYGKDKLSVNSPYGGLGILMSS